MLEPGYQYFDVGRTESLAIVGATAESRVLPLQAEIVTEGGPRRLTSGTG